MAFRQRDARQVIAALAAWAAGFLGWNPSSNTPVFAGLALAFVAILASASRIPTPTVAAGSALTANALFFFGAAYGWLAVAHASSMGLMALAVAACHVGTALWLRREDSPPALRLVAAALALAFVTLAIPIQLSGFSITLAWAVECAVLAFLAARLQNQWPFAASWAAGFLAIGQVLFVDSQNAWGESYSPLLNSRLIPFVATAICLAINAWFTARMTAVPSRLAAAPFLLAHCVMILGLLSEVFAWIESGKKPGTNVDGQEALASSLVLGLYGFVLVAAGFWKNFKPHRLLGLALFALVVLKLYWIDIWTLGAVYRIFAFVALGALLLSGSFLYSKYREKWKALLADSQAK
jgi:hypothetical protein